MRQKYSTYLDWSGINSMMSMIYMVSGTGFEPVTQ